MHSFFYRFRYCRGRKRPRDENHDDDDDDENLLVPLRDATPSPPRRRAKQKKTTAATSSSNGNMNQLLSNLKGAKWTEKCVKSNAAQSSVNKINVFKRSKQLKDNTTATMIENNTGKVIPSRITKRRNALHTPSTEVIT